MDCWDSSGSPSYVATLILMLTYDAPDGAFLAEVRDTDTAGVEAAVSIARAASEHVARATDDEITSLLESLAAAIDERRDTFAKSIVLSTGKPITQARREVDGSISVLRTYSRLVNSPQMAPSVQLHSASVRGYETLEPRGVALLVTPWNFPLQVPAHKIGAAIAARCPVVWKPSPLADEVARLFACAAEDVGIPNDWLQLVHGAAKPVHDAVRRGVDVISFTGGLQGGRAVAASAAAAPSPVPTILELGGRNANIVLADSADMKTAKAVVAGFSRNQGASCTSGVRVLVHESVVDSFATLLGAAIDELVVGDPFDERTTVGAIRTEELAKQIETAVADAIERGAHAIRRLRRVAVQSRHGAYLAPALLQGGDAVRGLERNEVFGPVATVTAFDDIEQAVALANDSEYGLVAGVWSDSVREVNFAVRHLNVGSVFVNHYNRIDNIPLATSGRKASGYGAEGGLSGVRAFQTTKAVHIH